MSTSNYYVGLQQHCPEGILQHPCSFGCVRSVSASTLLLHLPLSVVSWLHL
jgi:hypothetical protein